MAIKLTLSGALTATYEGKSGVSLQTAFPDLELGNPDSRYRFLTAATKKVTSTGTIRNASQDFVVEALAEATAEPTAVISAEPQEEAPASSEAAAVLPQDTALVDAVAVTPAEGNNAATGDAPAAAPELVATPAADTIQVTLAGAVSGTYDGPKGKTLKDMFPALKNKTYQVRDEKAIVGQSKPWVTSASLNAVEHARHG